MEMQWRVPQSAGNNDLSRRTIYVYTSLLIRPIFCTLCRPPISMHKVRRSLNFKDERNLKLRNYVK